jgi:hypothetical protein
MKSNRKDHLVVCRNSGATFHHSSSAFKRTNVKLQAPMNPIPTDFLNNNFLRLTTYLNHNPVKIKF